MSRYIDPISYCNLSGIKLKKFEFTCCASFCCQDHRTSTQEGHSPVSGWWGKLLGQLLPDSWPTSWPSALLLVGSRCPRPKFQWPAQACESLLLSISCSPVALRSIPVCLPFCGQMTAAQPPSRYTNLNKILFTVLGAYERVTVLFLKQTVSSAEMPAVSSWACHLSFQALCDVSRKKKKKFTRFFFSV